MDYNEFVNMIREEQFSAIDNNYYYFPPEIILKAIVESEQFYLLEYAASLIVDSKIYDSIVVVDLLASKIKEGKVEKIPYMYRDNPKILEAVIESGNYNLLEFFDETAYSDENISLIVNKILDGTINYVPVALRSNPILLNGLLRNGRYDLIDAFDSEWSNGKKAYTDENISLFIEKYRTSEIDFIPSGLFSSSRVLEVVLQLGMFNETYHFQRPAFNEKNTALILTLIKENKISFIPYGLQGSPDFLKSIFMEERYDLLKKFDMFAFDKRNILLLVLLIEKGKINNIPYALTHNPFLLRELLKINRTDLISEFDACAYTGDAEHDYNIALSQSTDVPICNNMKLFIKKIKTTKVYSIPYFLCDNKYLLRIVIKSPNKHLIGEFQDELFTPDIIERFIKTINDISFYRYLRINDIDTLLKNDKLMLLLSNRFNDPKLKDKMIALCSKNKNIFQTLNIGLLSKEFEVLDLDFIEKLSSSPAIQSALFDLRDQNPMAIVMFSKMINIIENKDVDIYPLIHKICNNGFKSSNFYSLFKTIDINNLTEDKLISLMYILSKKDNIFNINSMDDLEHLEEKRREYFEKNMKSENLNDLKNCIFEKKYGITLDEAMFIRKRYLYYCVSLEELRKSKGIEPTIVDFLEDLVGILDCKDLGMLRNMLSNANDFITGNISTYLFLEENIRSEYAKMYNKTLYHVTDTDKSSNPRLSNITYNGVKIPVYEVTSDFAMQIHALGAYSDFERPDNFKSDWNIPKIRVHGVCTSYIRQDELAVARTLHPILGFASYESSSLQLLGNYDLVSKYYNAEYSISLQVPSSFLPPNLLINKTRHNHNEIVLERRNLSKDGKAFKRQPDYVIYISDDLEHDDFSSEFFEEVKQAAYDFGVPVVVIDRQRFLKMEQDKIARMWNLLQETKDPDIMEEIFIKIQNNAIGSRHSTCQTVFNDEKSGELVDQFINLITDAINSFDLDVAYNLAKELLELLEKEKRNYSYIREPIPKFIEKIKDVQLLIDKIEQLKIQMVNNESSPNKTK